MNAEHELLNAYREWHRLARAETKAIRTHNWDLLADCHLAISDFQSLISRLSLEARVEWVKAGLDISAKERHVQVFVHELVELTRQNQQLLQQIKDDTAHKLDDLGEAGRRIKKIQRAYGSVSFAT